MKKSISRVCHLCSKTIKPRGMGGHMALAHGIREKAVIKYVVDPSDDARRESDERNKILPQIDGVKNSTEVANKSIEPIKTNTSNFEGMELQDLKVQNDRNLYTETDIKILLAQIINYTYQSEQPSQLLQQFAKMDMIEDFEKRFDCKFSDVKRTNQHISYGKTEPEHLEFAYKYGYLNYSR